MPSGFEKRFYKENIRIEGFMPWQIHPAFLSGNLQAIWSQLGCVHCVFQKYRTGHRATPTRNGRQCPRYLLNLFEANIPYQASALGVVRVLNTVGAHVDHHCSWLDPIAAHHFGTAYSSD